MGTTGDDGLKTGRLPLLALGGLGLVVGLWGGLARLGAAPVGVSSPTAHGPLMVSGFLGVVIALERAVAARAAWAYLGPALCGLGVLGLLTGFPLPAGAAVTAGSLVVVAVLAQVTWRAPALHHAVLALAAVAWAAGNALFTLGRPVFDVVPLWLVFLVGTIAAERLELTRVLPRSRGAVAHFVAALGLLGAGALVALGARDAGLRVTSLGALGLAAWLFRYDVARRTVRQAGLTRFIAVALLAGYGWLAVGGVLGLWFGHPLGGPRYDALLHAWFVGFVFSMIFGHAPIILPAVLGVRVPFTLRFYVHLGLLHAALVVRLGGALGGVPPLRQAGAWANVAAIALFVGSTAFAVAGRDRRPAPPGPPP